MRLVQLYARAVPYNLRFSLNTSMLPMDLAYYLFTTPRRKLLDEYLARNSTIFKGVVLDIGGRSRGNFKKPTHQVQRWVFVDIEPKHFPDIVSDVTSMHQFQDNSVDVILAGELFEHVRDTEKGIRECYRILRPGGVLLISV